MTPEDNKNFNFEEEMKQSFAQRQNTSQFSALNGFDIPQEIQDLLKSDEFKGVSSDIKKQMYLILDVFVVVAEAVSRACGHKAGMLTKGLIEQVQKTIESIAGGTIRLSDAYDQILKLGPQEKKELNAKSAEMASKIIISQIVLGMPPMPTNNN